MKNAKHSHIRQAWVLCFILGMVMLNFPFIQIFNQTTLVLGFPVLFLYLMLGWPASIFVIYLFSQQLGGAADGDDAEQRKE